MGFARHRGGAGGVPIRLAEDSLKVPYQLDLVDLRIAVVSDRPALFGCGWYCPGSSPPFIRRPIFQNLSMAGTPRFFDPAQSRREHNPLCLVAPGARGDDER
jgi:hypothetical protein